MHAFQLIYYYFLLLTFFFSFCNHQHERRTSVTSYIANRLSHKVTIIVHMILQSGASILYMTGRSLSPISKTWGGKWGGRKNWGDIFFFIWGIVLLLFRR